MKFRNKATKEIRKAEMRDDGIYLYSETAEKWRKCDWKVLAKYWEEYREEPKKFWWINERLTIYESEVRNDTIWLIDVCKQIGNYFETKEEAELAVRKLKAWKRLKDKGFMFCGTDCINKNNVIYFEFGERPLTQSEVDEAEREIDICFGGEE